MHHRLQINVLLLLVSVFLLVSSGLCWAGTNDSDSAQDHFDNGRELFLKREYGAAAKEFEKALEMRPSSLTIKRALAEVYFVQRNFQKCVELQLEVINIQPTEQDYYNLGVLYDKLGDDRRKADAFFKAATLYGSEKSWIELAKAYTHIHDYKGAVYAYRRTLGINPVNTEARYHLIRNLYRIGDYEGAAKEVLRQFDNKTGAFVFSFFQGLAPAVLMCGVLIAFSLPHVRTIFSCSPMHSASESGRLAGRIFLLLSIVYIYRHLAQNPFSSYFPEKVTTSMYLYKNPPEVDPGTVSVLIFSLIVIPLYYMKIDEISVRALFSFQYKLSKIMRIASIGFLTLLLPIALFIIFRVALISKAPEHLPYRMGGRPDISLSFVIYLCIIAPITEEFCFRGWLYNALKKHFKVFWSILLSSFFFLIVHPSWDYISLPILIGFGVVSAFAMEKTGLLWPSLILHAAMNSLYVLVWKF